MENAVLKILINDFPHRPGVYFFKSKTHEVLYVGKAISLKDRLLNYTQTDVPPKTQLLKENATTVNYIETGGEFEALLLEANLIQKHRPKYNVVFRDDKSYLYIFISIKEEFPKIFVTRKPKADQRLPKFRAFNSGNLTSYNGLKGAYFGPYPSLSTVHEVLKMLRRIFPFCQQKKVSKRSCFYSHIGLCHPCPSQIVKEAPEMQRVLKKEYKKNLFAIKAILEGRFKDLERRLAKNMHDASSKERFEDAANFRDRLVQLKSLTESRRPIERFLENPNFYFEESQSAVQALQKLLLPYYPKISQLERIECYDISNFGGKNAVGGEVVFIQGIPEKNEYRRYKIKLVGPNDVGMLTEMVSRRLSHREWPYPDLVVLDGGKPQVGKIRDLFLKQHLSIPLIGLAKRLEEIVIPQANKFIIIRLKRNQAALNLLQALLDETHRFALTYHRTQRSLLT